MHQGNVQIELHHAKCVSTERKQADIFKPCQTNGQNRAFSGLVHMFLFCHTPALPNSLKSNS